LHVSRHRAGSRPLTLVIGDRFIFNCKILSETGPWGSSDAWRAK
jgi:hypothetical protein